MPRGKKSKHHAGERHRQAQMESGRDLSVQTSAEEGDESSSSSSSEVSSLDSPEPVLSQEPQGAAAAISSPRKARIAWPCFDSTTTSTESQIENQSESQSEESAAATQAGAGQASGSQEDASQESACQAESLSDDSHRSPLDQKAMLLVQFMLRQYNMKQPITKEDMMKHVIRKHKSYFQEILKRSSELMVLAFGIDIKEADPAGHGYILVSKLHNSWDSSLHGQIMPKKGLLMTILCVIFMKGNRAPEEQICDVINAMGIHAGKEHNLHREPTKLITDLVKEGYLEYRLVLHSDPPSHEFLWGPQAYTETSKMGVLEFLARLHGTQPSAFPHWYQQALEDDVERTRQRFEAVIRAAAPACDLSNTRFSNPHMY
ncbi:PREDICTED: melanoma-associated antigen B18 [Myotis davidii]|uniref:Melanoma-associated antigen B10 n=1 Tax=Myotis davidii TaxID=225400 RepID=L5LX57_MYODS|nr:PREDICTED: melanoma-associated antigen B18 [Myotis davidii]ELK30647.1 Melanoma-associated antigen B10 [Myotis davidii]